MAKKLRGRKVRDGKKNRQSRQKSAPSRALLMGIGVGSFRRVPKKGPHTIRTVT